MFLCSYKASNDHSWERGNAIATTLGPVVKKGVMPCPALKRSCDTALAGPAAIWVMAGQCYCHHVWLHVWAGTNTLRVPQSASCGPHAQWQGQLHSHGGTQHEWQLQPGRAGGRQLALMHLAEPLVSQHYLAAEALHLMKHDRLHCVQDQWYQGKDSSPCYCIMLAI